MRRHQRSRCAGFTLMELVLGMAVSTVAMGSFVALWVASEGLSARSRTAMQGESEHRSNLTAIAALFRDAAPDSVAGFDANGRATSPRFRRVTGLDGASRRLGDEQTLLWLPVSSWGTDDQGARLGEVVVRSGTSERTLARRVPEGGLVVQRSGRTLTVALATYWHSLDSANVQRTHDQVEVCMRN